MTIVTYNIAADNTVTVKMEGMPASAKGTNTTVDIGGVPQGLPKVSFKKQEVVFQIPGRNAPAGKLRVTVTTQKGPVIAIDTANFEPTKEPDVEGKVMITGIRPKEAAPGDSVTLRGTNMKNIISVKLGAGGTLIHTFQSQTDNHRTVQGPRHCRGGRVQDSLRRENQGNNVKTRVHAQGH